MLTPAVKELVTVQRRKFGYMEWPVTAVGQQTPGGIGWNVLRSHEGISKRYEFQNLKDEDGALLPDDVDTLFLFRPKDLTDRQKYVLDQFVVRGGTLVAFVDAAEYAIGPQRTFSKIPLQLDATGSKQPFLGQLLHYGIEWKPKLVADMAQRAMSPRDPLQAPYEYFAAPQLDQFGRQRMVPIAYPYFFHPLPVDWKTSASELAKDASGKVDETAAASFRERFVAGMPSDEFLFQSFKNAGRGPGFYWPTWVGLREPGGAGRGSAADGQPLRRRARRDPAQHRVCEVRDQAARTHGQRAASAGAVDGRGEGQVLVGVRRPGPPEASERDQGGGGQEGRGRRGRRSEHARGRVEAGRSAGAGQGRQEGQGRRQAGGAGAADAHDRRPAGPHRRRR
jgi:hypothetical protein